jgi:hypothetical protein
MPSAAGAPKGLNLNDYGFVDHEKPETSNVEVSATPAWSIVASSIMRELAREPETARLETSAQSELMDQQLNMDGVN